MTGKYFIEKIVDDSQLAELLKLRVQLELKDIPGREFFELILNTARPIPKQKFKYKTIVFDLDGTLCSNPESLLGLGKIKEEAKQFILELKDEGYKIGIYTARKNEQAIRIINYFRSNGLEIDFVNLDPGAPWESSKPLAMLYVDDRGFRFSGDWKRDIPNIREYLKTLEE